VSFPGARRPSRIGSSSVRLAPIETMPSWIGAPLTDVVSSASFVPVHAQDGSGLLERLVEEQSRITTKELACEYERAYLESIYP
jgi:hypothetical protein